MWRRNLSPSPKLVGPIDALKYYAYELPDGSIIYADKAFNDYSIVAGWLTKLIKLNQ
jgi:hypothetical protein